MPATLHNLQVKVSYGAASRTLNGVNRNAWCSGIKLSADEHGFKGWECKIDTGEYTANTSVYRYGARLTATIDPDSGAAGAGTVAWQGMLRSPNREPDGTTTLLAEGWQGLVEERDEPLLWMTRDIGHFAAGDDEPFDSYFNDNDSIDAKVAKAGLQFKVGKGQDINSGDTARLMFWYDADSAVLVSPVLVRRIAGKLVANRANGGFYDLRLIRNANGPSGGPTAEVLISGGNLTPSAAGTTNFDVALGTGAPLVGFKFSRSGASSSSTDYGYKLRLTNLRIGDRATGDTYKSTLVVKDLATLLTGVDVTRVAADGTAHDAMPYFHTDGSWTQILDDMAAKEGGWRWAFWEGPSLEFGPWGTGTAWHINAFTTAAHAVVDVNPADDVYSHVAVYFHLHHSPVTRRVVKPTTQNLLAGLNPPRIRVLRHDIADRQKDATHAIDVATRLAAEYGTDMYAGNIELSYANATTDKQALLVRPGDTVTVDDYPGGTVTWRVCETDYDEDQGRVVLGIGRTSRRLHRRHKRPKFQHHSRHREGHGGWGG